MAGQIIHGENLSVLESMSDGSVDLIYIDPPFGTGQIRTHRRIKTGTGDAVRQGFGGRSYRYETVSELAYRDDMPLDEYLTFIRIRLEHMYRVLTETGSIYVHVDFHAVHHIRLMLDEIFGADRFLNEIIWAYDYGGRHRDRWPRKHDNILWYSKGETWTFNRDEIDRIPYMAPGLVGPEKAAIGKLPTDVWWMTIVPTSSRERTGYPTQKPLALVERIIRASSCEGDVVADFFGGSGTTAVAAQQLGREFIYVDTNADAVEIARTRLSSDPSGKR